LAFVTGIFHRDLWIARIRNRVEWRWERR